MSLRTPAQKSLVALALVVPLTLAACGSDKKDSVADATSAVASATFSAAPSVTESAASSSQAPAADSTTPAQDLETSAPATMANPISELVTPSVEPLAQGSDDPAAKEAFANLLNGFYGEKRMKPSVEYLLNNSCQSIASQIQDELNKSESSPAGQRWSDVPNDLTYDQIAQVSGSDYKGMPTVDSITDVKVDGDNATATVNLKNQDGSTVPGSTMSFAKENGTWKMCSQIQPQQ